MSTSKWREKDENGNYVYFFMHHEIYDHGRTEDEAEAILVKYFGSEPGEWLKMNRVNGHE